MGALHHQNHCDTIHSTMKQDHPSFIGTVVTGESSLPNWLSVPDPKPPKPTREAKELLHLEYEHIFERVIEDVYRGRSLQSLIEDDHRVVSYEDFLRWVKRDPVRHERFKEAQEMRTEFLAGEILEIADGIESVDPTSNDTVNRDKLRIDTRKWLMSAHNKKRYGETKQIELGGSISITEALAQAQARVIEAEVIDVTPRIE
jgi:DNA primase